MADSLCHVFRWRHDGRRNASEHHDDVCPHDEEHALRGHFYGLLGTVLNVATADQYISIILTGNMFRKSYEEKGYESCLLSRCVEDSVTVTSVLVPWNSCGLTQSTVLNVPTLTYLPYCFFNYLSPLMSIVIAAIGYKIVRLRKNRHPAGQCPPVFHYLEGCGHGPA